MEQLRIVTWNLNHWQRRPDSRGEAWHYLFEELSPDIALVQECVPPHGCDGVVYQPFDSRYRPWGTAVVVNNPELRVAAMPRTAVSPYLKPGEIEDSQPGTTAAAVITFPSGKELVAVSAYGAMEAAANGTRYASMTLHRIMSDFTPVLDAAREKRPVVFGGDLNCSTQIEAPDRAADTAVFTRLEAFGMTDCFAATSAQRPLLPDCFCSAPGACVHQRTLRHNNDERSRPWHIDYFFTHHIEADRMRLRVVDDPAAWALSDHAPVVLDLRPPPD